MALGVMGVCSVEAQSPPRGEYEVKAAYLFSFARFVEWPQRPARDDAAFTICILGTDQFGAVLDRTIAGATIRGLKVGARRVDAVAAAAGCHIVFISGSEERQLATIVPALIRAGALTVSDMPHFTDRGGMIQFVSAASKVRFEINPTSTREAGLTMSSELLRVASTIRYGTPVVQ